MSGLSLQMAMMYRELLRNLAKILAVFDQKSPVESTDM